MNMMNPERVYKPITELKLEDVVSANRAALRDLEDQEALDNFELKLSEIDGWYASEIKLAGEDYAKREELNRSYEHKVRELCQ